MMASLSRRAGVAAVLLACALAVLAQVAIPPLTSRVTDVTSTLNEQQRSALEERLAAFEARKGTQIAVLIVPTVRPEEIEQYSIRVAEQWKVGRKGVDDGAILVIAIKDRALRIEVGYGLEGALTDATANRIVEEHIVPRFKQGDYFGGIDAGVSRMMSVIEGEPLPPPKAGGGMGGASGGGFQQFLILAFLLVFVVGGMIRALLGRFVGSGVIGVVAGAAGWLMLGSLLAAALVAIIALVLSLMGGLGGMGGVGRGRRGGWYGGFPGGGGWSGGGGSWGGGGGGFGGGGASGRW